MGNFARLISAIFMSAFSAQMAFAADQPRPNVFNADMSHPDLAAIITAFETVCLPFITHTTDLPQSLDQQHHVKLLSQQGFQFHDRARKEDRYLIKEAREAWEPELGSKINAKSFTVFNLPPSPPVNRTTAIIGQSGEIGRVPYIPGVYKTITRDMDNYVSKVDARQMAILGWNYASQNHPGKSCDIVLKTSELPSQVLKTNFIEKDTDWRESWKQKGLWSQCTVDGQDEYEFTAVHTADMLSLSVRRNDLYENRLCDVKR